MRKFPISKILMPFAVLLLAAACSDKPETVSKDGSLQKALAQISGIDFSGMDTSVRPQDDFYRYANGKWLESTEIPADEVG